MRRNNTDDALGRERPEERKACRGRQATGEMPLRSHALRDQKFQVTTSWV